jgi:hypothetical protein
MSQLKGLHDAGKGLVGVILPDTTSSTRYVAFDLPYLTQAFTAAGYSSSDFKIDNAQGSDATELADAQSDITLGATVLVFDPLDSTVGAQIQTFAQSHGVATISYDRATFQGTNVYYVSFDNVQVGKLIPGLREGVERFQPPGVRARWWRGHRPERGLVRPGIQLGDLELDDDTAHCGVDQQCGDDAGRRPDHARLDQRHRGHHLPAAVHRTPEHQRHR